MTRKMPSKHWTEHLTRASLPCGPVNTTSQVFEDPQVNHLDLTPVVQQKQLSELRLVGTPFALNWWRLELKRVAPDRGEHTDKILSESGLRPAERVEMRQQNNV